jgi:bacterioferritin-associated ferredoxin
LRVICKKGYSLSQQEWTTVYICLCNALTDRKVKQAATATGSTRPVEIYAACGCRVQCGQCVRTIVNLLRDHASPGAEQLAGAD